MSQQLCVLKLLLSLYTSSPGTVLRRTGKNSLGAHIFQGWSCRQVVWECLPSGYRHWHFPHANLGVFEQQFQVHFFPVNVEVDAINTLEGTAYHQGGRTVDNYLDSFQTLVSDTGYTDPWTLVVKFRWELKLGIQNQIATMPYGRPANTDPNAWYRAAQRIDQARLANEAFQSVLCSALLKTASTWPLPLSVVRLPPASPLLVTPKPLPPTPLVGIPMDVDTSRRTKSLPLWGCYWCGDTSHLVWDCPHCKGALRGVPEHTQI